MIRVLLASNSLARANKVVMYNRNIFIFLYKVVFANFLLSISLTFWIVNKAFTIKYLYYLSIFCTNCIFALEKIGKNIFKTTFILVLINKKEFSKNQTFPSLF